MKSLIFVDHLVKIYQLDEIEFPALRGVTLSIQRGEFVAIMGPSGSGKSTFMNILGCLDQPTKGRYELEGLDVSRLSRDDLAKIRNQKIGFVFQSYNLLPRLDSLENVELPLLYNGLSTGERRKRALQTLSAVGLESKLKHHPNQLSGGEQQRVAVARALVNNPAIILADEPTGNLDSRTGMELMALFQRLNAEGITIIVITHEREIAQYAKRIITFRDGKVREDQYAREYHSAEEVLKQMPQLFDEES